MMLTLLTPQKIQVLDVETDNIFVPGLEGKLNILPNHSNFLSEVDTGIVSWNVGGKFEKAFVSHGWVEVFDGQVTVMANVSELGVDIDQSRAKDAEKRARAKMASGGLNLDSFNKHELKLKRAVDRQDASKQ